MEHDCSLLKSQKNEVFDRIVRIGLEPKHFIWDTYYIKQSLYSVLAYKDNREYNFRFLNDHNGEEYWCSFSPGMGYSRVQRQIESENWEDELIFVNTWLGSLKKEIEAPDFWGELEKYQSALTLTPSDELVNEPIPAFEADEIHDRLLLFADKVEKKFNIQEEESKYVRQKLNYLSDEARKQPRRNWENMVIGVMITLAFQYIPPEQAQSFFALVKECLGDLIHLIGS